MIKAKLDHIIYIFIVWFLKKHNVVLAHGNYVVRMFTKEYYENVILNAEKINLFDKSRNVPEQANPFEECRNI